MTFLVKRKTMKKNMCQMLKSPYLQRSLVLDNGRSLVQVLRRSGIPSENSPHGACDHIAEEMLLQFAESGHPIFRATTPVSRGQLKSKGHGKLSTHFAADQETIETVFRIIVFANQLDLYGAVANICEEYESLHDRSGQPDVLMGQSIVFSEIKAEVLLENDIPSHQNLLLQRYEERIEMLSQENRVSNFSMDAGFISVVEIGQCSMT